MLKSGHAVVAHFGLLVFAFSLSAAAVGQPKQKGESVKVIHDGSDLLVVAYLDGKPLKLYLDSGDPDNRIFKKALPAGFSGNQLAIKVGTVTVQLDTVSNANIPQPLKKMSDVDGTLGVKFLKDCAVGIDYQDQEKPLQLWPGGVGESDARTWLTDGFDREVATIKLTRDGDDPPYFMTTMAGLNLKMVVDTGSEYSAFSDGIALPQDWIPLMDGKVETQMGLAQSKMTICPSMVIGGHEFGWRAAFLIHNFLANTLSPGGSGFPRVVIDYNREKFYFPLPRDDQEDWYWALSGLSPYFSFNPEGVVFYGLTSGWAAGTYKIESIVGVNSEAITTAWKSKDSERQVVTELIRGLTGGGHSSALVNGSFVDLKLAPILTEARDYKTEPSAVDSIALPANLEGATLLVRGVLNGKKYSMLLNSETEDCELPFDKVPGGKSGDVVTLKLGSTLVNVKLVSSLKLLAGEDGWLGRAFLESHRVGINYLDVANPIIVWPVEGDASKAKAWVSAGCMGVRLSKTADGYSVSATSASKNLSFALSTIQTTGVPSKVQASTSWSLLGRTKSSRDPKILVGLYMANDIRIAGASYTGHMVASASNIVNAVMGLTFFGSPRVLLDFAHNILYISAPQNSAQSWGTAFSEYLGSKAFVLSGDLNVLLQADDPPISVLARVLAIGDWTSESLLDAWKSPGKMREAAELLFSLENKHSSATVLYGGEKVQITIGTGK